MHAQVNGQNCIKKFIRLSFPAQLFPIMYNIRSLNGESVINKSINKRKRLVFSKNKKLGS